MGGLFYGIEIAGVDHVDHGGVGGLGQFVAFYVVFLEKASQRRPARRQRPAERDARPVRRRRHWRWQHCLYFLPLLQWQGCIPSDFGHLANFISKDGPSVSPQRLADARFHEQLLVFDRDLAAAA